MSLIATLLLAGTVVALWNRVTVHPVSMDTARERAGLDSGSSAPATPLVPAAGVYRYQGTSTEHLDKPPRTQPQGPDIPGPVTGLGDGCWRLRVDYSNHRVRTLTGGQRGTEEVDTWFDATTGLPVRNSRVITVHSDSVFGSVTYTERGTFTLVSSTPTR